MVDLVNIGSSLWGTFTYNEQKVEAGVAELLAAQNYPMDMERMGKEHRLNMLLKLAARRPSVKANSVHITLNFAPGETLPQSKLRLIADDYMKAIGFGEQPYLVYQHFDAGHPHIHICTVKVDAQGNRINTHLGDYNALNKIRQGLENKYGLIRAEDHKKELFELIPASAQKAEYGKTETRRAIASVLNSVIPRYNYTSLGELNAILKGYNVAANPGTPGSRIHNHKGLVYQILNAQGVAVGAPIPASHFPMTQKPTLKNLEVRFEKNKVSRKNDQPRIPYLMDLCFKKYPHATFADLQKELSKSNVRLAIHENESGQIFGLTYVDYQRKCAYNGAALGKKYSANAILKRCDPGFCEPQIRGHQFPIPQHQPAGQHDHFSDQDLLSLGRFFACDTSPDSSSTPGSGLLEIITRAEALAHYLPYELRRKKKKRKKRRPL